MTMRTQPRGGVNVEPGFGDDQVVTADDQDASVVGGAQPLGIIRIFRVELLGIDGLSSRICQLASGLGGDLVGHVLPVVR